MRKFGSLKISIFSWGFFIQTRLEPAGYRLLREPQYSGERTQAQEKISRLHRTPCEVSGSIPLISTKMKDSCSRKGHESFIVKKEMGGYLILTCQGLRSSDQMRKRHKELIHHHKSYYLRRFIGRHRPEGPALFLRPMAALFSLRLCSIC